MRYRIIDQSTAIGNASQYGGVFDDTTKLAIRDALMVHMNRDKSAYYGGTTDISIEPVSTSPLITDEVPCYIVDTMPNAPKDVAYHDFTSGSPYIFVARNMCNSLTDGADSISGSLGHEINEADSDPDINLWVLLDSMQLWAYEMCDPTQEDGYLINGIYVPNFVTPAFWKAGTKGRYDFLQKLESPLSLRQGGYQIIRTANSAETQLYGDLRAARRAKKYHGASRTAKRLNCGWKIPSTVATQ